MKEFGPQLDDLMRVHKEQARGAHEKLNTFETEVMNEYDNLSRHLRQVGDKIAGRQSMLFSDMKQMATIFGAVAMRRPDQIPPPIQQHPQPQPQQVPYRQSLADATRYLPREHVTVALDPVNPITNPPPQYRAA